MPSGIYTRTDQARRNIGLAVKGRTPWNKGQRGIYSEETLRKISRNNHYIDKPNPQLSKANRERIYTSEMRMAMSKRQQGSKGSNWQGGITPINEKVRHSVEAKLWTEAIFKRDNYTCRHCGERGGILNAHHILNFASHVVLRFAIDNGETLCFKCHRAFHKQYGRRNNNRRQFDEWNNVSRPVKVDATSKRYSVKQTSKIQGLRMAQTGKKNNNSNNTDNQMDTA